MRIVTVRRISQVFFLLLFLWFCIVASFGVEWWQLRGWPVNWFLQLDPLVAVGTMLTTRTLYAGLLWALLTVVLTILLGRFFCGWVCPFGSIHHFVGYLGRRGKPASDAAAGNRPHRAQSIKYYLLLFLLSAASGTLLADFIRSGFGSSAALAVLAAASTIFAVLAAFKVIRKPKRAATVLLILFGGWTVLAFFLSVDRMIGASLQTGLLDPIPLVYRSVNLVLLPLSDSASRSLSAAQRHYEGVWLIALVFGAAVLLNLKIPRFYCRFVCPLGALYGVLGRFALWRVGKKRDECSNCGLCEAGCEGACEPAGRIRTHECVLCMNCLDDCSHGLITYRTLPSASGEVSSPDLSRRGMVLTLLSGIAVVPVLRLGGELGPNWNSDVVRPPGALAEEDFLARCIKCGLCMRVCPTNVIRPAGIEGGLEGLWTPALDFRTGTSGCQMNCVICGYVCPTAAIRSMSPDEKLGRNGFAGAGPVRIGTAFVDHGRCLPWAMDRPCIVCQENCPVSPKAIFVREHFSTVRDGIRTVKRTDGATLELDGGPAMRPGDFATGDYFLKNGADPGGQRSLVIDNTDRTVTVRAQSPWAPPAPGSIIELQVRLQRPQVDPERCIGCGVCEHECPVNGRRAIRVSAENESRSRKRSLLL